MASQGENEPEFWESLENSFGREIPVDSKVRDVINAAIKESRELDPEKRAKVIDAAVYLAYDIVTVAFRGEDAKVAKEAKAAAEEYIRKLELPTAEETAQMSSKEASEQEASGAKISPGDFLEQFEWVAKLKIKDGPKGKQKEGENGQVAKEAKEAAEKYGKEELELMHEEVSADEETKQMSSKGASEQEASGAKIPPEELSEQSEGVEMLETKGVPKGEEKEEEEEEEEELILRLSELGIKEPQKDHYVINKGVSNIRREIIENFVEKYREDIFYGNDYQQLVEDEISIHGESGLPTLRDQSPLWWAHINMQVMKGSIERLAVSAPSGETHSDKCDEDFSKAKKELLSKVIDIMFYVFESRVRGEKLHDDPKIEQLGKTINMIIYPDLLKMPYGVYVDHQALNWWQKEGGDVTDFFNSIGKVRNMFQTIPEFVVLSGKWAFRVHKKLRAKASSSQ